MSEVCEQDGFLVEVFKSYKHYYSSPNNMWLLHSSVEHADTLMLQNEENQTSETAHRAWLLTCELKPSVSDGSS